MNGYYPYGGFYGTPAPSPQPNASGYSPTPPQPSQPQMNYYAFVDGIEGAKAFRVNPGSMMLLMDSQNPICYKKQVNDYGQTISFETYDLVPHKEVAEEKPVYITKDEFEKEIAQIKAMFKKEE